MSPSGLVFDVSEGCIDDGPGLRTVVFLKGCALGCPWCHNPEGISPKPEVVLDSSRCLDCGGCADACPNQLARGAARGEIADWRAACQGCGRCADACPSGARRLAGRRYQVDELVQVLLRDRDYFDGTGGGVTFSGGEPLLQSDFVFACAAALRAEGVHVAVETAGSWSRRLTRPLAAAVQLVLFDLKHVNPCKWLTALAGKPQQVLDNLTSLLASDVAVELRVTLVPGFNDAPEEIASLATFLAQQPRRVPIRLQAMQRLATAKSARLGRHYLYAQQPPPSRHEIHAAAEVLRGHDLVVARD